ncbi:hypothetical protein DEO72_LG7g2745 [Vigna unguiculata]|uniref:PGG domain-containing protein n=1 Tax=Vigna unguiculata TaxID=3917 RepID=A0A4D6MKC1_VIGUN|nr:hypothetical protein DEO72_LG7g2745 [Vigna unguiculata]
MAMAGESSQKKGEENETIRKENDSESNKKKGIDKKETPFLAAARNGIVEIVCGILFQNPNSMRETNSKEENVLLVAARNRKPLVLKILKLRLRPEFWNTLSMAVDKDGKTMLHLAAEAPTQDMPSHYVTRFVPQHYQLLRDKDQKTPREIFNETHEKLRKDSGEWLKETSESCSVVAALVAAASFATATTVPGGIDDNGIPHLEENPAFNAFIFASLFGLCFSVTGLIMFLTILTSRKLPTDYRRALPLKLLLGLSSLFLSIIALLLSFCTGHSFLFTHKYKKFILPIYVASFPVTFFALDQVPLYVDLLAAILVRVPKATDEK